MTTAAAPKPIDVDGELLRDAAFITRHRAGDEPLVATAIHHGHEVRDEVRRYLAIAESDRRHEEDLATGGWTAAAPLGVIALRSRFEVDLNRPREEAVYPYGRPAWGKEVWREPLPEPIVARSLAVYDLFYRTLEEVLERLIARHGRVLVLDLHSYNHRRPGPGEVESPAGWPDIDLATESVDHARFGTLVERFIEVGRAAMIAGARLDVRENVRFRGGHFPRWVNGRFDGAACAIAVEVKKSYVDASTGAIDHERHAAIGELLAAAGRELCATLAREG